MKQYSKEFKDEALELAGRLGVSTVAKELDQHESFDIKLLLAAFGRIILLV